MALYGIYVCRILTAGIQSKIAKIPLELKSRKQKVRKLHQPGTFSLFRSKTDSKNTASDTVYFRLVGNMRKLNILAKMLWRNISGKRLLCFSACP